MGEKPFSLLLVDDSRATAARLVQSLGSQEYALRVVSPSPELLPLALEVDLVLLCLGQDSELALLRRLLNGEGPGLAAPVVVVAPAGARQVRLAALRLGVEVVAEPWDGEELRLRMHRALAAHQALLSLSSQLTELQKLSVLDGLTLLHNRRYFDERLREEFRAAQRYDDALSLILVDLDSFNALTGPLGPSAGDEVLRHAARVLKQSVRETDIVARHGGEQFAVLLPRTPLTGAITVAERVWQKLTALRAGPEGHLPVAASLGVSTFPHRSVLSPEQLLLSASEALARARREGSNRVCLPPALPLLAGLPRD